MNDSIFSTYLTYTIHTEESLSTYRNQRVAEKISFKQHCEYHLDYIC